jgi:hypothetical protein
MEFDMPPMETIEKSLVANGLKDNGFNVMKVFHQLYNFLNGHYAELVSKHELQATIKIMKKQGKFEKEE